MKLQSTLLSFAIFSFSFSFAQIKFQDLNIDSSITGFHYAADFQGTMVFTKNGPADIYKINPTAFSFTIGFNMTPAVAKKQLENLLNMSKKDGYIISSLVNKDTTLNGNTAYYISYTETKGSYKNIVFNSFVIRDKTVIIFVSGDLDDGQYIDKFKKTFYSIKL